MNDYADRRADAIRMAQHLADLEGRSMIAFSYGRAWHIVPAGQPIGFEAETVTLHPQEAVA